MGSKSLRNILIIWKIKTYNAECELKQGKSREKIFKIF